jgi:Amt family ammonium transporter
VNTTGAVIIGVLAGIVPFLAVTYLKKMIGCDDALDTFGVHGVGGTMGALVTGLLADEKVNPVLGKAGMDLMPGLLGNQIKAILLTMVLSIVGTAIIAFIVKAVVGLRPSEETESMGLDLAEHGEEGYHG